MTQRVKCVLVGDSMVGKTYLLSTYIKKKYPNEYKSFESTYSTGISVDDLTVDVELWDTAGREEYDRLRPLCYNQVNVVVICFSIDSPASCEDVENKWRPEVKHYCPDVPILLVGTKRDLREDQEVLEKLKEQNQIPVTQQEGAAMAQRIKAVKYVECASISQDGLEEVFNEAVRAAINHSNTTKKPCVLL